MALRQLPRLSNTTVFSSLALFGIGVYCSSSLLRTGHAESNEPPKMFSGVGLTTLRLQSVKAVNQNTKRLVFEFPDATATSGLSMTSSLLTVSRPEGRWFPVIRPYTPISSLTKQGSVELMVRKYPNGKASTHIHSLAPGDTLTFLTALKGFPWSPNKFSQVHLIAGGAGITPIFQLIQGILDNPADKTKINLIFGVNNEQDLLLREELESYKTRFPDRFNYIYTISHPKEENSPYRKGHVTEELLKTAVTVDKDSHVFVSGPPAMEASLLGSRSAPGILSRLGFAKGQIYQF